MLRAVRDVSASEGKRLQLYYGIILIEEWNLNVITKNGWMEGDLLDFAMSSYWLDAALPTTSASCYVLPHQGNWQCGTAGKCVVACVWLDRATIQFRFIGPAAQTTGSFCVFGPAL
jgi:hypothetical protein